MTHPSLQKLPSAALPYVAQLAAEVIERAASFGSERWGVTPYPDGIRINVGWTEILTACPKFIHLIVDGVRARKLQLPDAVSLIEGKDSRGYYPTVPGSLKAKIPYEPSEVFERSIEALRPALLKAVSLAARRRAGRGVREGHRQEVVDALAAHVGRVLPSPNFAVVSQNNIAVGAELMEGALRRVMSSEYERNPAARRACIEHYGTACFVCGFSFEATFGELGRGFIHVHHLTPVSSVGANHAVDPINDLRPVCPNCHAMLHREDPPLTIEALRTYLSDENDA
ncbi:HNH endonuclease [Pelomicrobium sp. G1]|uniref:HNH endonuclease n=1 Tax=unclassified Pelomicrobium TaxID=2815318 RepID=UPI003F759764